MQMTKRYNIYIYIYISRISKIRNCESVIMKKKDTFCWYASSSLKLIL